MRKSWGKEVEGVSRRAYKILRGRNECGITYFLFHEIFSRYFEFLFEPLLKCIICLLTSIRNRGIIDFE